MNKRNAPTRNTNISVFSTLVHDVHRFISLNGDHLQQHVYTNIDWEYATEVEQDDVHDYWILERGPWPRHLLRHPQCLYFVSNVPDCSTSLLPVTKPDNKIYKEKIIIIN